MEADGYTTVLRERLGDGGYDALEEMMRLRHEDLLTRDRFDERLTSELAVLRSELRGEMTDLRSELRGEMTGLRSELSGEMQKLRADIRIDIAERSSELMKWAMLFWVGQAAAVAGIIVALR